MAKKQTTGKFVAYKHKHHAGPRVTTAEAWKQHKAENPKSDILIFIGEADTAAEALKLCK